MSVLALARAQVSRRLSRRLPYYLTPEEAHQLIELADKRERSPISQASLGDGCQGQ